MSVRRSSDDVPDTKHMLNMDDTVLAEFQALYDEAFDFDPSDMSANQSSAYNAAELLKKRLTGEYTDPHSGEPVKYMMYNIPRSASPDLKNYMQKLKNEYEALNMTKRSRSDVVDLPDSINPKHRARIIELRGYIEGNKKAQQKWKDEIKRNSELIITYQNKNQFLESLLPGYDETIKRFEEEIERLSGAPHTGCRFIVPTSTVYW